MGIAAIHIAWNLSIDGRLRTSQSSKPLFVVRFHEGAHGPSQLFHILEDSPIDRLFLQSPDKAFRHAS